MYVEAVAQKQQPPQTQGTIVYVAAAWEKDLFTEVVFTAELQKICWHF